MEIQPQDYLRFVSALVFVIALIGVAALLAKRFGMGHRVTSGRKAEKRLSMVEVMPLDGKRRLILVQRDNTEHLLMLGPTQETVVETGIDRAADAVKSATFSDMVKREPVMAQRKTLSPRRDAVPTPRTKDAPTQPISKGPAGE